VTDFSPNGRPRLSILVAAYEEERTLEALLRQVAALGLDSEIIVVDDGSRDATPAILERLQADSLPQLRVITHPVNRGKGAAVRTAIAASEGEFVAILDADLEYDPVDLPRLVAPLFDGRADVVYGTRLRGGSEPQRAHMFWHYAGNRFLTLLTNVLFNTTLSDMEVGYKAFRGDLIRALPLTSEGFDIEPEVTAKLLRRPDTRLYELPVAYYGRTYAEGKKITWRDGARAVATLVRLRIRS
jgi:glycosyltransferase involved in cell wall biosynthesis